MLPGTELPAPAPPEATEGRPLGATSPVPTPKCDSVSLSALSYAEEKLGHSYFPLSEAHKYR